VTNGQPTLQLKSKLRTERAVRTRFGGSVKCFV
jgi:hypothetical protein